MNFDAFAMVTFSMEVVFSGSINNHLSNIRTDKEKSINLQHLFGRACSWSVLYS